MVETALTLDVVEFEPEGHNFVVEVVTGLDELNAKVLRRLSSPRRLCKLNLLLNYLLFLFFQLVDEVWRHLKNYSHKVTANSLVDHVFKLNFLANQVNSSTCFL